MYIFINETGEIFHTDRLLDDDFTAFEYGIVDIIDISGPIPKIYIGDGKWSESNPIPR